MSLGHVCFAFRPSFHAEEEEQEQEQEDKTLDKVGKVEKLLRVVVHSINVKCDYDQLGVWISTSNLLMI